LRDLSTEALDGVASYGALAADVVRLHRAATARLTAGWYDTRALLDAATAAVAPADEPVIVFLPRRCSQAEVRFLTALIAAQPATVVLGLVGDPRADEQTRTLV